MVPSRGHAVLTKKKAKKNHARKRGLSSSELRALITEQPIKAQVTSTYLVLEQNLQPDKRLWHRPRRVQTLL